MFSMNVTWSVVHRLDSKILLRLIILVPATFWAAWYAGGTALRTKGEEQGVDAAENSMALRDALQWQPLNAPALRELAIRSGPGSPIGDRFLRLSDQVSRRDLTTQLYLLELQARSGENENALRHYDAALSVYPSVRGFLLPILVRGLEDPDLRAKLRLYADRPWFDDLIRRAAGSQGRARWALALADQAGLLAQPLRRDAIAAPLLAGLLSEQAIAEAGLFAERLGLKGWDKMEFNSSTLDPRLGPLGWKLENSGFGGARVAAGGGLDISLEPLRSVVVAKRQTIHEPGLYQIGFEILGADQFSMQFDWQLDCPKPDRKMSADIGSSGQVERKGLVSRTIAIQAGCVPQYWTLRATGSDYYRTMSVRIAGIWFQKE
jgi:hypothetical protein